MMTAEFLFFALFFMGLSTLARRQRTDLEYLRRLRTWTWIEFDLFLIFTALAFFLQKGFMTPYGLVYLLSLGLAVGVTIRMRITADAMTR
jgi:hypothetical protein